jgi:plasmid maintenance system antidote protein VapI
VRKNKLQTTLDSGYRLRYIAYMRFYTSGEVMKFMREKAEARRGAQKQLAAELGISPQYLNDILSDKRRLTPEIAAAIGFRKQPERYVRVKGA